MAGFDFFKKIFSKEKKDQKLSPERTRQLRLKFKARYYSFKQLLGANNKALEIMSELEEALHGCRPFGMTFVRSRCTLVCTNVYTMVQNLCQLAPGKYDDLKVVFHELNTRIDNILRERKIGKGKKPILFLDEIDKSFAHEAGSKMANLGELKNKLSFNVPDGFVITASAYVRFLEKNNLLDEIARMLQATPIERTEKLFELCSQIQNMILKASLPQDLEAAIFDAYARLEEKWGSGLKVSMRSSALGEDSAETSFAGQYRSELNISKQSLIQAYKDVVASKYTPQAVLYRFSLGLKDEDVAMCVGCMPMVNARSSGVMYSMNPTNFEDKRIHISSTWGVAKAIVDGLVEPDMFFIARDPELRIDKAELGAKKLIYRLVPDEGVMREQVSESMQKKFSISKKEALALARLALACEEHYGFPQDMEWSISEDGQVYILQTRPLIQNLIENIDTKLEDIPAKPLFTGGQTAASGVGLGEVYKVEKDVDLVLFPEGSILVARNSSPRLAMVLPKSSGVITEYGSVTGHLANVAREFNVPALVGVKGLMDKLKQGEKITLDADLRAVFPGKVDMLTCKREDAKKFNQNCPVYRTLKKVCQYIVPLNLLEPEDIEFKPSYCRTLHDITRFAHEKAVIEMFNFGREHDFASLAPKQLKSIVPMQWWVIDLDDGFKEGVQGKYVHLKDIRSVPMLALWRGIVAVPWEGPPQLDKHGFMSVLMQATTNPNLVPSLRSDFAMRNYFMISRDFCHLQSRFGFHFSSIEALVGERRQENYIRFQFKGGAADLRRRKTRAEFVGQILEEYGFEAKVREDALFARIDRFERKFMVSRLKILGYLLIHTRQLDMIMGNRNSREYYWRKMIRDIDERILTNSLTH